MKISRSIFNRRRRQNGSATFVFIVLLAIMMILVTANGKAIFRLHRELNMLEQKQNQRLNVLQTNVTSVVSSLEKPGTK
jgi:integral membrane sensor domain MASE1